MRSGIFKRQRARRTLTQSIKTAQFLVPSNVEPKSSSGHIMSESFEKFKKDLTAASPAPYCETLEYKKFMDVFFLAAMAVTVAVSYSLYVTPIPRTPGAEDLVLRLLPALESRVSFLGLVDEKSKISYLATVLSCLFICPILFLLQGIAYWKTVISKGVCVRVSKMSAVLVGIGTVWIIFLIYGGFIFIPYSFHPGRPGMSGVLFWPMFPLLGGSVAALVTNIFFCELRLGSEGHFPTW